VFSLSQEFQKPDFKLFLFIRVLKNFEVGEHLASIKKDLQLSLAAGLFVSNSLSFCSTQNKN
jgi:hypothetical protein